ncbi:hypothetical protein [Janthinobacterium sp. UMAB-60]|uniref:hypothetical protein n=1 Tax=Janthinobacterium sp. UMAB-60 TaxID=1365365 RepID=UPI001C5857C7|nr:hypothetical protein [Janthinobacterium sp. UMAB-60]
MEMRMTDSLRQQAYAQAAAFVRTLDRRDPLALQRNWSLSPGVADEIIEMLDSYFAANQALSLAPLAEAFVPGQGGRCAVDVYATDCGPLGLECRLLADGRPGEATLHLEISGHEGALRLHYQYIGS